MILVALLYGIACVIPAVYFDTGPPGGHNFHLGSPFGYTALLCGWIPPFTLAWSANIAFVTGCVLLLCRRYYAASTAGWVAAVLGLTTWALVAFREIPYLLPGYYLWQASLITLATGARSLSRPTDKQGSREV
jgi:hypothetical protein